MRAKLLDWGAHHLVTAWIITGAFASVVTAILAHVL